MIQLCDNTLSCNPCPEGDPTNANLSAEKPDLESFFAVVHYFDIPPLGGSWGSSQCTQTFTSTISQQDADLKALAAAQECAWTTGGGWRKPPTLSNPNGEQRQIYANSPQQCQTQCQDGSPTTFTLPGNLILSIISQADADEKAHNYACQQARAQRICLQPIDSFACQNAFFETDIFATAGPALADSDSTWSIIGGALPTGMELVPDPFDAFSATIQGTPTVLGTFSFTVLIILDNGDYAAHTYSIVVGGIVTASSLPDAPLNDDYSQQLTTAGMDGTITWSLLVGLLPDGLTLDPATGLISGIPTESGTFAFTVSASNEG
jgi:hypothetical protein